MGTPVVEVRGLVKDYGRKRAVDGLDLTIEAGEVYGLLGNNGAGKTTTIHALLGLVPFTAGAASVLGLDPAAERTAILREVGFFSEADAPYEWLTVAQLCRMGELSLSRWDAAFCAELLQAFSLDPAMTIGTMSKGMLAKAKLVMALAHRPRLVVLDEPRSGLDPGSRHELLRILGRTTADRATTVLFSSHDLDEVDRIATRVGIIARGRLALSLRRDEMDSAAIARLAPQAGAPAARPEPPAGVRARKVDGAWEWMSAPGGEARFAPALEAAASAGWSVSTSRASLGDVFHFVTDPTTEVAERSEG